MKPNLKPLYPKIEAAEVLIVGKARIPPVELLDIAVLDGEAAELAEGEILVVLWM